ncbi:MAG: hypothetical protein ACRDJE_29240 [Dehalococcoidia bacterium]
MRKDDTMNRGHRVDWDGVSAALFGSTSERDRFEDAARSRADATQTAGVVVTVTSFTITLLFRC